MCGTVRATNRIVALSDKGPARGAVLTRLPALPGALIARMSGSGATCFALFETTAAAEAAAATLRSEQPRWWVAAGMLN